MERRDFLGGILCATALAGFAPACARAAPPPPPADATDVTRAFGFVGDGRTDNYEAFHRWADHVNRNGGGSYVFPPGTYYVARYRTAPLGTRDRRHVINSDIFGANGLTIHGYGARIVLNGRFHRTGRKGPIARDGLAQGEHMAVFMPFDIRRSRNVRISGLEIDGGVLGMSRDLDVGEAYAHLIAINACTDVVLEDLDLHHGQSDAIFLGDDFVMSGKLPGQACRNVSLRNVKCRNNARGGLAPLQVHGLKAVDCEFNGGGFPGGNYHWHAPGFGVDIEPDHGMEGENIDIRTGNLEFVRCNFYDNFSAILACYTSSFRGYCRFIDCNTRNRGNGPNHIIATWPGEGIFIEGGDHDAGEGRIWVSWQGQSGAKTTLRNMRIRSADDFGILHGFGGNLAVIENCTITGTHTKPGGGHFIFFGQVPGGGRRNVFRGNKVFLPAARKDRGKAWDLEPNFAHTDLSDNEYTTDLRTPGQHFARGYDETCTVRNERFRGAFPGPHDTFRPIASGEAHDTRRPYSAN